MIPISVRITVPYIEQIEGYLENAHMTVIEALMVLYAKEVASSGRISSALERISGRSVSQGAQHHEAALLSWISHVCSALKRRIDYELTNGVGGGNGGGGGTNPAVDEYGQRLQSPTIAPVRDFRELCDGVCLAYLISYYCPKLVPWHSVKFNHVPTIEDSIHNILIVSNFSERSLPYSVFHMTPEDITYMRGAMKQNLVVLLADLFNLFEIHPAKCVCYPGMEQQQVAEFDLVTTTNPTMIYFLPSFNLPLTVTRSPSASTLRKHVSTRDMHDQQQPQYSQHPQQSHQPYHQDQDEGVPTLSSMQEPLVPARIRQAKEKTNNDSKAEERGDSIPAGRPSNWEENRKQSFSGRRSRRNSLSEDSQLTIENFGGSQDQLNTIGRFDRERKTSSASLTSVEPVTPARSSIADARGSIQFGYDTDSSGNEKQDRDTEKPTPALRRHNSTNLHSSSVERDIIDGDMSATHGFGGGSGPAGPVSVADVETTPRRKTSFATLPNNTTTWQQQAISVQKMEDVDDSQSGFEDATKISTIKLKLEEKRRLIEQEKRRMETAWSKQLQTVGKQAFLQAINKWNAQIIEPKKTPDLENMDLEQYQQSISKMNSNLHDIQADIQRLTQQQTQIQAQTLQAQQLLHAQQIANLLNQDPQQDEVNEKGFYISFDNEQPKRPKPPLRTKRSPKKDKLGDGMEHNKESEKPSHRENNQNNFGTFSVKTANSFSANFNEEQVVSRKSIIDSASSPFETAATGSSRASNNNMAATMDRDIGERRHLEDVTNHTSTGSNAMNNNNIHHYNNNNGDGYGSENENQRKAKLVIGNDEGNLDPNSVDEMERKKEKIMLLSLQRRQQAEEAKARKEIEAMQRREKEREKEEERARKKEEQFARRQAILEAHKLKKAIEEAEREGKTIDRELLIKHQQSQAQLHQSSRGGDGGMHHQTSSTPAAKMRPQKLSRPRPKTIHVETGSVDLSETSSLSSRGKKGSNSNLTGIGLHSSNSMRRDYYRGSQDSLAIRESPDEYPSSSSTPIGRRGSYKTGREPATIERGRTLSRISLAKGANFRGRKSNSLMNLCGTKTSPKLYKQPATKSNRGIILNAVEYCVFPGAVNREAKQKVLEKIARSEAKHFLVLFRDAGCQFRALYGYWPENEQIIKLYGTGPSQVDDVMFDKFFKYNSGGKCFSQVHTKHLTVTIDAFTIHNSLWQGKKANLPSKKDMALVI
ncbi:AAEL010510-PA [Aedes aegypti]|uniref:AAEL010510-PA n=1 Tax=Aedes aegypti TaxID=7159 RepID=Q16SR6_AEDAE|nr:AAEL010510-PA [Aedes aegypti]